MQQKRDSETFKKSQADDLTNMQTGIFGYKGRVHFQTGPCINEELEALRGLPKTEVFTQVSTLIDKHIHRNYRLYPGNYVACDLLNGTETFAGKYTPEEKKRFEAYLQKKLDLIQLPNKDEDFLRQRILTMYANPAINHLKAILGACKEDEYVYPNVITTFIDAATDESGTLQKLITDKGESLQILNREGLDGLTPDSIYRSVSIYEPKESADEGQATALLYSCQLIIAVKPVTVDKLPEATAKTDPLDIQSVWKSGNYINLILLPMAKEKSHIFHFIDEGISDNGDGSRTLHLTLYHNQNGDYEAFTRKSYLSIPLWAYEGQLTQGDKVVLRINTYEKGFVSYEFTY